MFNWTCPFCDRAQTVGHQRRSNSEFIIEVGDTSDGKMALTGHYISCANPECHKTTISVAVRPVTTYSSGFQKVNYETDPLLERHIIPEGTAKPQPVFIPAPLVQDYNEACLIRELSPKAAATLIRRCLQGMLRDFAGVRGRTLYEEIDALRKSVGAGSAPQGVTDETVEAIDHVRRVGNIGAHMEVDINHIVEVEAGEADALIQLVEMLFEEWYVARYRRQQRLSRIAEIAANKDFDRAGKTPQ